MRAFATRLCARASLRRAFSRRRLPFFVLENCRLLRRSALRAQSDYSNEYEALKPQAVEDDYEFTFGLVHKF